MGVIDLRNINKQFGTQIVLRDVSLEVFPGEVVGLVGANGAGKTTLFRIIAGELAPDTGELVRQRNLQIGYLTQEPAVSLDNTLHDEVAGSCVELLALERRMHAVADEIAAKADDPQLEELMATYERLSRRFIAAGGHDFETRMHEILGGLGFKPAEYDTPLRHLSGGQKCRTALAKLLLTDSTYLLLDEPTNHLDIEAVTWLEKFLANHRGGAVVISHDRYLLDRLCKRIVELESAGVRVYSGNYSTYVEAKDRRILTEARQFEKDQAFIEKERAFIAKHLAGTRTKEAKGRRTRLERRLQAGEFVTDVEKKRQTSKIVFGGGEERGDTVLRVDDLTMGFTEKPLFRDLSVQVFAGDRFGITGPNGVGKTTLLRILIDELEPQTGTVEWGPKLRTAHYAQEPAALDASRTVLEELRAASTALTEQDARNYLARFLFRGDDVFKPLGALSGGEQSRVRMASLILQNPDVLILDEPTNHLDIPTCEVLEEALSEYRGTILCVSHDRYFLDRVMTRLLVLQRDHWKVYAGNYSFYVAEFEQTRQTAREDYGAGTKTAKKKARKAARDEQAATPAPRPKTARYDHLSIDELEAMVIEREVALSALQDKFADPAVLRDPEALAELKEQIDYATEDLSIVESAWHERVEQE